MKEFHPFLITWVTHYSRISERMIRYQKKKKQGFWMNKQSEEIITKAIAEVVKNDNLKLLAYNICGDHVHLVLVCEREEVSKIIQKLKSISAKKHNIALGITLPSGTRGYDPLLSNSSQKGIYQNSLWAQKFHSKEMTSEEELLNAVEYIRFNRIKHNLPPHYALHPVIKKMICSYEKAFGK